MVNAQPNGVVTQRKKGDVRNREGIEAYTAHWHKDSAQDDATRTESRLGKYTDVVNGYYDGATELCVPRLVRELMSTATSMVGDDAISACSPRQVGVTHSTSRATTRASHSTKRSLVMSTTSPRRLASSQA